MSPSSAPSALQHLHQTGAIEEWEFRFCKEFWSGIQGNGPHQGLSHPEEAEFRLHTATSIGRYLLAQFSTDDA